VMAALTYGRPLVLLPMQADQPLNAQMCQDQGVGIVLSSPDRTPAGVRNAVMAVLHDPAFRQNAAQIKAEMAVLPGLDEAAEWITCLAREQHPQIATGV